jgi:ABC-type protease/lipase transport system fused ATPase/permease subunit
VAAREALGRLGHTLRTTVPPPEPAVTLPRPARHLWVQDLAVAPPGSNRVIVRGISFALAAGTGMALLGASGSGKSSLAKAIVGLWHPARGAVRLDGARLDQWQTDALGRHVGYLPQEVGLFDGTVADNISRFEESTDEGRILEAAAIAGAHNLILSLPDGYATRIGEGGALLSAGQRQRIGLARAVYGEPFLIVLDEPNANLDGEGEEALGRALIKAKAERVTVLVIAHRLGVLTHVDRILLLQAGAALALGPRDEVLGRLTQRAHGGSVAPVLNVQPKPGATV